MDAKADKPHRIRVRTLDGKPRDQKALNKLKSNELEMPHLDIVPTTTPNEFIICAAKEAHIEQVRAKLSSVGLAEIPEGDTTIAASGRPANAQPTRQMSQKDEKTKRRDKPAQRGSGSARPQPLPGKPYGFVALPENFASAPPIWHDGTSSAERLSGEIRFELTALTPLLVGWERGQVGDSDSDWPVPPNLPRVSNLADNKSVLCPLRAPWGKRPVIIPGDSLKGLLRQELGALLGAPMERVAERSYSYRPNLSYPDSPDDRFLEPRLARVRTQTTVNVDGKSWPVPEQVDVLSMATRSEQSYYPRRERGQDNLVPPPREAEPYRGGLAGGEPLPEAILSPDARRKVIHTHIDVRKLRVEHKRVQVTPAVRNQYVATLKHLLDTAHGHFSARHPHVGTDHHKQQLGQEAIENAALRAFQPGDLIWVEWDTERKCIVSFGWHYYYRWAYVDTVCRDADAPNGERRGLFPLPDERAKDSDGAPRGLSPVRLLLGYTGDNDGSAGIGKDDHAQLMGRISINAALEVVGENETDEQRFLPPTFLRELGMPRPSAVEFYLKQPYHPRSRPSDRATLVTYGDAAGYDEPGALAGRKFYLDRRDAYTSEPWKDDSPANRVNERSTLALEASKPGRKFRFTLRFRDLDSQELAAILVALCPDQFKQVLGGTHPEGYCSKLGYARPLGWGSVRIEAKALFLLDALGSTPDFAPVADILDWVKQSHRPTETQEEWLAIHRHKHPDAADYPRAKDRQGNENIYTFHTTLRAEHARARRYRKEKNP